MNRAVALGLALLLGACSSGQTPTPAGRPSASAAVGPASFTIEYRTGSIPPPYNYTYRLTGRFEDAQLVASYVLTYQYRGGMTTAQLESQGYSGRDDLSWTGRITGDAVEQWRILLRDPQLKPRQPASSGATRSPSPLSTRREPSRPASLRTAGRGNHSLRRSISGQNGNEQSEAPTLM